MTAIAFATPPPVRNRYLDAPRGADYTIDQRWESYTAEEHGRWDRLRARQARLLPGRACDAYLDALRALELSESGIPHFGWLSDRLERLTGWRVVPVADLVPDAVFYEHLANRRFPAGAFIRPESELDYIEEPDVFHDVFGHVPMLASPVFADYMQAYGQSGLRAHGLGVLHHLARLYWYTVEFGLVATGAGLRIYGAGILSSASETVFALEHPSPHRIRFDLERVMRTRYVIDDFQKNYFVVDSLEALLAGTERDLAPVYARVRAATELAPGELDARDTVLHRGDLGYFTRSRRGGGELH